MAKPFQAQNDSAHWAFVFFIELIVSKTSQTSSLSLIHGVLPNPAIAAISSAILAVVVVFVSVSGSVYARKCRRLAARIRELEASLEASVAKGAAERRGRVRAQQVDPSLTLFCLLCSVQNRFGALREALAQRNGDGSRKAISSSAYPMSPIGVVQSCFSTRNGTPRQPLLVPLARACLVLDPTRVPAEGLEGLADYSHCWILYVFHLNTDLDKLWKEPSRSKFKAKVRVPRLEGGKMGVLATRSPHRPCPIGLTVAKVEAVDGHSILLSGVDLVDGTPVLDIKPYLPYSDSVEGATVPNWVKGDNKLAVRSVSFSPEFASSLSSCWVHTQKQSLYGSADEFRSFIEEVLAWDISYGDLDEDDQDERLCDLSRDSYADVVYHLLLEGINVSYRIDEKCNVVVEKATLVCNVGDRSRCGYFMWRDKLEQKK
uniref:TsaA-like domain-containing protein n=1 Tax=Ananas comosus var. bracteatus TaxID=296719 RepID=A0A6V7P408_ANACO|nr:unnamed protein product [Ananas comosus var. bracteatus]